MRRSRRSRPVRPAAVLVGAAAVLTLAACGSSAGPGPGSGATTVPASRSVARGSTPDITTVNSGATGSSGGPQSSATPPATSTSSTPAARTHPMIVLDPGHAPGYSPHTDAATGLPDGDYENEPEMQDVWAVAQLVKQALLRDGYRVVLTKPSVDSPTSLGARAAVANRVHAALAVSIHDQAGANGGIPFASGNNIVYYQSVGAYRETPSGKKIVFTNAAVAATSERYGAIFQAERSRLEGHAVRLQGNVGYDLGSRGKAPGNMWIVQLLSHVPWIYNEAGGNSAGTVGLDSTDKHRYAAALLASIERCVPNTR